MIDNSKTGELLAKIKANRKLLDGCLRHKFDIGEPPYRLGMQLHCLNCNGKLDAVQAYAYARGYEAAGRDPNEIIPGFK